MTQEKRAPIKLDKCKAAVVEKYLKKHELSEEGDLAEQIARLQEYQFTLGEDKLAGCDICNGYGYYEDPCCFCGDEAEPEEPDATPKKAAATKKKTNKKKATKKKPVKKPAKKAIVKSDDTVEVQTVAMLDAEVKFIRDTIVVGAKSFWEIGIRLNKIRSQGLHTLRKKDGAVLYKTWSQFLEAELDIKRSNATKMMLAAENFTEEQVTEFGFTKLAMLAGFKPMEQKKLIGAVTKGATQRELSKMAKDIGESGGRKKSGFKGTPNLKGRPAKSDQLTVVLEQPARTLKFTHNDKPAKSMSNEPTATELTANGVLIVYKLSKNEDGEIILKITSSRQS